MQVGRLLGDERVLDEDDRLGGEAGEVDEWQRGLARGEIDGAPAAHAMGREGDAGEEVLEELLRVSRGEVGDGLGGHDPETDAACGHAVAPGDVDPESLQDDVGVAHGEGDVGDVAASRRWMLSG